MVVPEYDLLHGVLVQGETGHSKFRVYLFKLWQNEIERRRKTFLVIKPAYFTVLAPVPGRLHLSPSKWGGNIIFSRFGVRQILSLSDISSNNALKPGDLIEQCP